MSAKSLLLDIWELVDHYGEDRRISNTEFRRYFYRETVSVSAKAKGTNNPKDFQRWTRFLRSLGRETWLPAEKGYAAFEMEAKEAYVKFPVGTKQEIGKILDNMALSEERDRILAKVTDETLRAAGWAMVHLEIRCPVCGAADGEGCVKTWANGDEVRPTVHVERITAGLEARDA